jgi:hypothetical protein
LIGSLVIIIWGDNYGGIVRNRAYHLYGHSLSDNDLMYDALFVHETIAHIAAADSLSAQMSMTDVGIFGRMRRRRRRRTHKRLINTHITRRRTTDITHKRLIHRHTRRRRELKHWLLRRVRGIRRRKRRRRRRKTATWKWRRIRVWGRGVTWWRWVGR